MDSLAHEPFDLLVVKGESNFAATVLESPAGEGSVHFQAPLAQDDLQWLRQAQPGQDPAVRRSSEQVRKIGSRVFQAVFAGKVGELLRLSLNKARQSEVGLCLRLRLSEAGELSEFPWEFLYDSTCGQFLALQPDVTLVRSLGLPMPVRKPARPPIRMLVVSCLPIDRSQLETAREWDSLKLALKDYQRKGLFELDRIDSATLGKLEKRLEGTNYHILHFIGHGSYDRSQKSGELLLADRQGMAQALSSEKLSTLLNRQKELRLVVLNCCDSARTSLEFPFAGLAQSLLALNLNAVVAMQFPVKDQVALDFVSHFYTSLGSGLPIDAAAAEARRNLYLGLTEQPSPDTPSGQRFRDAPLSGPEADWGAPVVYLRSPDGFLFDLPRGRRPLPESVSASWQDRLGGRRPAALSGGLLILLVLFGLLWTEWADSPAALPGKLEVVAQLGSAAVSTWIAMAAEDPAAESIDQQIASLEQLQSGRLLIFRKFFEVSTAEPRAVFEEGQRTFSGRGVYSTQPPTVEDLRRKSRTGAYCWSGKESEATGAGACSRNGGVRTWKHDPSVVVALICEDNRLMAGDDENACGSAGTALQIRNSHIRDLELAK